MSLKTDKEKKKARMTSAKKWASEQDNFARTTLTLPTGVSMFSIKKPGAHRINIILFQAGESHPRSSCEPGDWTWERTYYKHGNIGPKEQNYVCPLETVGKPCPVCEHRVMLRDKGADKETLQAFNASRRQLMNVMPVNADGSPAEPEKGVQIWDVSYYLFGKNLKAKIDNADEDDGYDMFADPEDGFTLKIGAVKASGGDWCEFPDIEFKKREPISDEITESSHCLDDLIKVLSYEELSKIFHQTGAADEDQEEDDRPTARNGKVETKATEKPPVATEPAVDEEEDSSDKDVSEHSVGSSVAFTFKGEETWGKILSIDASTGKAKVKGEDGKTYTVDVDEMVENPAADEEETPAASDFEPEEGDEVSFDKDGEVLTGVVESLDGTLAQVKVGKIKHRVKIVNLRSPEEESEDPDDE